MLDDELLGTPVTDAFGRLGNEDTVRPLAEALNRLDAKAAPGIAAALTAIHCRFEQSHGESTYISDLAWNAINEAGLQHLLDALPFVVEEQRHPLALTLDWLEGDAVEQALPQLLAQPAARSEALEALVRRGARAVDLLLAQLDAINAPARQARV